LVEIEVIRVVALDAAGACEEQTLGALALLGGGVVGAAVGTSQAGGGCGVEIGGECTGCAHGTIVVRGRWWAGPALLLVDIVNHASRTVGASLESSIKILRNETLDTVVVVPELVGRTLAQLCLLIIDAATRTRYTSE
jgi:hypothetical protein